VGHPVVFVVGNLGTGSLVGGRSQPEGGAEEGRLDRRRQGGEGEEGESPSLRQVW
jgi:hypothetical protein